MVGRFSRAALGLSAMLLSLVACADGQGAPASPALAPNAPNDEARVTQDTIATATAPEAPADPSACPAPFRGSCTQLTVPLNWQAPAGKQIQVFVDRVVPRPNAHAQLWLLQGGPGLSTAGLIPLAEELSRDMPDTEVLLIEHRGIGLSTKLECSPKQTGDSFFVACEKALRATWGDDLKHFGTTAAAQDLLFAMKQLKAPAQKSYLYGVSYGTSWATRAMQLGAPHIDGVVLDSVVTRDVRLSLFDTYGDGAGKRVAAACAKDTACRAQLGADPWARAQHIRDLAESGHCPEAAFTADDRARLGKMLRSWSRAPMALSALARFERCSQDDVTALGNLRRTLDAEGASDELSSVASYLTVGFSELWETPAPSATELARRRTAAVFPTSIANLAGLRDTWPTYEPDLPLITLPTSVPTLVLSGGMDPQTPVEAARELATRLNGPMQHHVEIAAATHEVIAQSPYVRANGSQGQCGYDLMVAFLGAPTKSLDATCASRVEPAAFSSQAVEKALFGGASTASGKLLVTALPSQLPGVGWAALPFH